MSDRFRLSVVVPVYNEEPVLPELLRRTRAVLDGIEGGPHEIVFVDDGSTDGTLQILETAAEDDARLLILALSRNFGHQAALSAGLDHATGHAVVILDGDLQDPPEAIPLFLERFQAGFDVVYGQRVQRKEVWWLRLCYYVFYRLITRLSDVRLPLDAGDFGLMSRRVVEQLRRLPEHHRYLRGLRTWVGFRQIGIPVERSERQRGKSKYSPLGLLKLAFDGIFAFSVVPLRAAALLGAVALTLSGLFAIYSLYVKLVLHQPPKGFTALTLLITFLSGVNLLSLGIIGEYVGRIYEEIKARPLYVIGRIISHGVSGAARTTSRADAQPSAADRRPLRSDD